MNAMQALGGIPSPSVGVWYLGPLPIRAYALAILTGILVGAWLANRRYRARGGPAGAVSDALIWAVPFGIIGARIYHVISSPDRYFGPDGDILLAVRIWEGGLGVWGAIPMGALGAWIGLRRAGLRLAPFADAMAPGILLAQGIGRLGNYFNQELFGEATTLPWGLQIDESHLLAQGLDYPAGTLFHPTFAYELLWNLAMAALLIYLDRRLRLRHGRVFWAYVAMYTAGRVWIEMLRIDEAEMLLGLRLNVWTSIAVFVIAVTMFIVIGRRTRGEPDPIWLPGREPDSESSENHHDDAGDDFDDEDFDDEDSDDEDDYSDDHEDSDEAETDSDDPESGEDPPEAPEQAAPVPSDGTTEQTEDDRR
ncbi:MAG: prolipoprotein diacylglyceryl transferase [Beutenbergiaceae bacterium]